MFAARHPPDAQTVLSAPRLSAAEGREYRVAALGLSPPSESDMSASGWRATSVPFAYEKRASWGSARFNAADYCSVMLLPQTEMDARAMEQVVEAWVKDFIPGAIDPTTRYWTDDRLWRWPDGTHVLISTAYKPDQQLGAFSVIVSYSPQLPPPT